MDGARRPRPARRSATLQPTANAGRRRRTQGAHQTLRRLERDGVLTRTAYAEIPPRVDYELTPLGRSLEEPIRSIATWAEQNIEDITAARDVYDRNAGAAAESATPGPRDDAPVAAATVQARQ